MDYHCYVAVIIRCTLLALVVSAAAWAQAGSFARTLYPVLEKVDCRACHNTDGVASATRLHFPEPEAPAARIEEFGRSLVRFGPLLLDKPTNRVPHAGAERIKQGSADEAALKAWIQRLAQLSGEDRARAMSYRDEESGAAPRAELRRLTHSQYNHTVRDLLGDQTAPANQFPSEDFVNGFRNQSQGQSLSPLLIEGYGMAAERLARNAFRGGDTRGLIPCKATTAGCGARFVREFGLKAFRRPLEAAEQKRYEALLSRERDFLKGAQIVIEAMLQSPNFLFRLAGSSDARWKPYATASGLAYTIWDSMPDAELLAAAGRGELGTAQGVEKAARRMLDHPRAREALDEFVSQWLRFDRILTASKDRRRYPQFTRETAIAMTQEARAFVGDLVWNERNFMDFYTAGYSFMNADLAVIYGVAAPEKEFDRVAFPAGSERAGVLGQTLFLALTAKPDDSSPTARGLFVREQFLCQRVADPPPGVSMNLPPVTEAKPQTNRDRMSEHATNPSCATCHNLIDPIGFGLERFDGVGARRDKFTLLFSTGRGGGDRQAPPKSIQLDIDATGHVAGIANSKFSSPAQLGAVLAESPQCQECVVKQYFRYTAGRLETPADRPVIRKILDDFRGSQFRFKELIVSLIRSREFPNQERTTHVAGHHEPR